MPSEVVAECGASSLHILTMNLSYTEGERSMLRPPSVVSFIVMWRADICRLSFCAGGTSTKADSGVSMLIRAVGAPLTLSCCKAAASRVGWLGTGSTCVMGVCVQELRCTGFACCTEAGVVRLVVAVDCGGWTEIGSCCSRRLLLWRRDS